MTLRELLSEIGSKYPIASNEPFTNHPLAKFIREESKKIISPIIREEDFTIKGSAGMGNWTSVPWIGIFNKNETDGAQEGVYVVYLYSTDFKRLYLCLGQGITKPIKNDGRKLAFSKLKAKAINIRANYQLAGFKSDDKAKIADKGLGSDYEEPIIYYKEYRLANMPDNEELVDDLKKVVAFYDQYLANSNLLTSDTDFRTSIGQVEEGKRKLIKHYTRERNAKIVKEAKSIALRKSGELRCEICGFSFRDRYGSLAQNYIEGHHIKPVASMKEGETTSVEDILLICSNCHRVIHLKYPPLTIDEVRKAINNQKTP